MKNVAVFRGGVPGGGGSVVQFLTGGFTNAGGVEGAVLFYSMMVNVITVAVIFKVSYKGVRTRRVELAQRGKATSSNEVRSKARRRCTGLGRLSCVGQIKGDVFMNRTASVSSSGTGAVYSMM